MDLVSFLEDLIFLKLYFPQVSRVKKTAFLAAPKRAQVPDFDSDEEDDGSYTRHPQLQGRGGTQMPPVKRVRVLPPVSRPSMQTNSFLRFSCGKCSQRFAWPDYLENHIRSAHFSRTSIRPATIRPAAPKSKPAEAIVITSSSSEEEEDEEDDDEETLAERSRRGKRSSLNSAPRSPPPKKINFSDVGTIMGLLNGART